MASHSRFSELESESAGLRSCKICVDKRFASKAAFISHLTTFHSSIEGGSYICTYGDNKICNACPGVGVSHNDYIKHVNKHHTQMSLLRNNDDKWVVNSSCVNLPAALNDPAKGKQKDFFTRAWGIDFVDTALLPSSPHICELPPNCFDRYIRKVRKHYSGGNKPPQPPQGQTQSGRATPSQVYNVQSGRATPSQAYVQSGRATPGSSRETTPSPLPGSANNTPNQSPESKLSYSTSSQSSPRKITPAKLDIPAIFFDQNFDLSNPATFNAVFPFLQDSLSERRSNPFQIDTGEVRHIEKSGKLLQEKLSHHLDQVEVSIAHQVAAKSHHFFQVMTYHDALMSQLRALISVVRTLRERLDDVEKGVVLALKVPQMCLRKNNIELILKKLNIIYTLHQTQPTIQVLLSRQEFSGALDLISTSQDIIKDDVRDIVGLKHLPSQLDQLMQVIDCTTNIPVNNGDAKENGDNHHEEDHGTGLDQYTLSSLVSGLVRQESYSFLEFFEETAINAVKRTIKDVVLEKLDLTEEKTLTSLVAEFALVAQSDAWTELLDLLVGSLIVVLRKMNVIYKTIKSSLETSNQSSDSVTLETDNLPAMRLNQTADEVMVNICDQVHERLGKLVTVRSRPNAVKLVTPKELSTLQKLINILSKVTGDICGRSSAGLQLSQQGQTILFIQQFHEAARNKVASLLEKEKWKRHYCKQGDLSKLRAPLDMLVKEPTLQALGTIDEGTYIQELRIIGCEDSFAFVESIIFYLSTLSSYVSLLTDLPPKSCDEVALKIGDLLKLFNSRTCQLVLGAGAVSLAGLKTITIRNLAITLRSLEFVATLIPHIRKLHAFKVRIKYSSGLDNAVKDYNDHLGELERKIYQIVDAALQQQLATWQRKPPVPSNSFKQIGKQLSKLHEAIQILSRNILIQDILPASRVTRLFQSIHNQFLKRVADTLKAANLKPDNSPSHGLVVSELIFYRENLKYMNVLSPDDLHDAKLQTVWKL